MCARKMMYSDVQKVRQDFSLKHGAIPNFPPRWNISITDRQPIVRMSTQAVANDITVPHSWTDQSVVLLRNNQA